MSTDEPTRNKKTATGASTYNQTAGRDDYTRFHHDLLTVIAGFDSGRYSPDGHDGAHGLASKARLEDRYGEVVNHGRLYPNLDTLVERGLVEKSASDRRTNIYTLTDAGLEFVRRRAQWVQGCLDGLEDLQVASAEPSTTDEGDDELPGDVDWEAVGKAAANCETVKEVADELDVPKGRARSLLVGAGLYADVSEGNRR